MPLAFLPSVLEDRGHSAMKIATAIGAYYWMGFLGCFCITSYQIYQLIYARGPPEVTSVEMTKNQIRYLICSLTVGSVTLICQAMYPSLFMHTSSRVVQGFAGAFIFFYAFLLSVQMFTGQQQVFAMTAASIALNVAEVLGSTVGAVVFDAWGQSAVFGILGVASVINQIVLCFVLRFGIRAASAQDPKPWEGEPDEQLIYSPRSAWTRFCGTLRTPRLLCAVILISMAATVKGSVEEMLPFHADHRWGFTPLEIGNLFAIIALAYIIAAVLVGFIWNCFKSDLHFEAIFCAVWLSLLGLAAGFVFLTVSWYKQEWVLWIGLVLYGLCLGLTHTPAALLLADAIDHEEGKAKDAVNGIWNTMWEAGGSIGFLLAGLFAEHYSGQIALTLCCAMCCFIAASTMVTIATAHKHGKQIKAAGDRLLERLSKENYGATGSCLGSRP